MNKKIYIFIFFFFLQVGCEGDGFDESRPEVEKKAIDMSVDAVNKRWFSSEFRTPIDDVTDIAGGCISWGGSGQCTYSFKIKEGIAVSYDVYDVIECPDIYERAHEIFNVDGVFPSASELLCKVSVDGGDSKYWIIHEIKNRHYVWEVFSN